VFKDFYDFISDNIIYFETKQEVSDKTYGIATRADFLFDVTSD
jgi:hypothetical protein